MNHEKSLKLTTPLRCEVIQWIEIKLNLKLGTNNTLYKISVELKLASPILVTFNL